MPLGPFPDVEDALCSLILTLGSVAGTGTVTPEDLASHLPFVRVSRIGGAPSLVSESAVVDVDTFGVSRADARPVAEEVLQLLIAGPSHIDGVTIDRADVLSGPVERVWNDEIRRWHASYRVSARR